MGTEVTRSPSSSAMVREPTNIHSGDTDSGSSITEQQKMPDLSEQTKLVQRKNNSMSAVVVPVSTSSSGDEGGLHEDMEDKPLDSAGEEVPSNNNEDTTKIPDSGVVANWQSADLGGEVQELHDTLGRLR